VTAPAIAGDTFSQITSGTHNDGQTYGEWVLAHMPPAEAAEFPLAFGTHKATRYREMRPAPTTNSTRKIPSPQQTHPLPSRKWTAPWHAIDRLIQAMNNHSAR
jgi:hypothetical protein